MSFYSGKELVSVGPSVSLSMCLFVLTFKHKYLLDRMPIAIKLYMKHHAGRGTAASGFGTDQIRTMVSIATDSSQLNGCFLSDPFYTCM